MTVELAAPPETTTAPSTPVDADGALESTEDMVLADLLVEDVSIDGMCGVY